MHPTGVRSSCSCNTPRIGFTMPRMNTLTSTILSGFLAGTAASVALAAPQSGPTLETSATIVMQTESADGTSVEMTMADGKILSLRVDGEEVPADRVRQNGNMVEVLDGAGKVLHQIPMLYGTSGLSMSISPRVGIAPSVAVASAKSMIGVGFGEVDEALAHHLEIDPSEATMVTSILDQMPAHKAGLEKFDVIVAIDGKPGAPIDALRQAIANAAPGTKMKLSVRRGSETKDVEVETAAFDAAKIATAGLAGDAGLEDAEPGENVMFFIGPDGRRREIRMPNFADIAVMPEMPDLSQFQGFDAQRLEEIESRVREMVDRLNKRIDSMLGEKPGASDGEATSADAKPADPKQPEAKSAPAPAADAGEDRLRRMEERMEELRRELEREREARKQKKPADA